MSEIQTERLLLRQWRPDDLDPLAEIFASDLVWRYPRGHGLDRDATQGFLERFGRHWAEYGFGIWAAELRQTGALVGYVGLQVPALLPELMPSVEVGYRLDPSVWRRGLATEGAAASLAHGFQTLGLDRIIGIYQPENVASGRVMRKVGMRGWRSARDEEHDIDLELYEITRQEWEAGSPGSL